jgi:hypothetical protein
MFKPERKKGIAKYGIRKSITESMLEKYELSHSSRATLEEMGGFGLARSTWSTYATAKNVSNVWES